VQVVHGGEGKGGVEHAVGEDGGVLPLGEGECEGGGGGDEVGGEEEGVALIYDSQNR